MKDGAARDMAREKGGLPRMKWAWKPSSVTRSCIPAGVFGVSSRVKGLNNCNCTSVLAHSWNSGNKVGLAL